MDVQELDDPEWFLQEARPLLLADEARHNLLLGIADTLIRHPGLYDTYGLWLVRTGTGNGGDVVGAALRTPPQNLLVARPATDGVIDALARAIHGDAGRPGAALAAPAPGEASAVPGVSGAAPEARAFADIWASLTGASASVHMELGVFELTAVRPTPSARGTHRVADASDRPLLLDWLRAFGHEAHAPNRRNDDGLEKMLEARLAATSSNGFWLWTDGGVPVSLAGYWAPAGSGIRVGPVYTPPDRRGRGYATSLVAEMSAWLLAQEYRACFLFTDLANPTSNAIYERIGYRRVCDALDIAFTS